jgi:hypothetical protein
MRLAVSFFAPLGSVILALYAPATVEAVPIAAGAGFVTLPLQRIHHIRSDVSSELVRRLGLLYPYSRGKR